AGGEFIEAEHEALISVTRTLRVPLRRVRRAGFGLALSNGRRVRVMRSQTIVWRQLQRDLAPAIAAFQAAGSDRTSAAAVEIARQSLAEILDRAQAGGNVRALAEA